MADPWKPPVTDVTTLPSGLFTAGARRVHPDPPQVRKRPELRDRTRLPGYMNEDRVAEQRNPDAPTHGSQYGHTNDEAHAWFWI